MTRKKLFGTHIRALQYLRTHGESNWTQIYNASDSRGTFGNFVGPLEERNLVKRTRSYNALGRYFAFYKLTKDGKDILKDYPDAVS